MREKIKTMRNFEKMAMDKKIKIHCNLDSLEDSAKKQFDECCSHDFVLEAALMPDAHSGYVAPIGSVIKTKGTIVPAWVGYDIGCGMIAIKISEDEDFQNLIKRKSKELFDNVNDFIPMGAGRHNDGTKRILLTNSVKALSINTYDSLRCFKNYDYHFY